MDGLKTPERLQPTTSGLLKGLKISCNYAAMDCVSTRTPKPIVDELAGQLAKIVKMQDVVAKLKSYYYVPRFENPEEFGKHIQSDTDRWKRIVKETGFKIE